MNTAYQIAWNLIEGTSESSEKIHHITGVPLWQIDRMRYKANLLAKVFRFEDNIEVIKELINEVEQGKPHYPHEETIERMGCVAEFKTVSQQKKEEEDVSYFKALFRHRRS